MNRSKFGVQANYSYGGQRKRYNVGRYVANKYKSNKAYTRRVNVRRNIKSGETTFVDCSEAYLSFIYCW